MMKKFTKVVLELVWMGAIGAIFIGVLATGMQEVNASRGFFGKPACKADGTACAQPPGGGACTTVAVGAVCDLATGAGCNCGTVNYGGVQSCACE